MREVRAAVDLRHRRHEVALRHVADRQRRRRGRRPAPPRGRSACRHRRSARSRRRRRASGPRGARRRPGARPRPATSARRRRTSPTGTRPCRRAPSVVSFARLAIAPLIPALATFANVPVALAAVPGAVRDAPEVDRARRRRRARPRAACVDVARDPERAHEVPARAARDDGDLRRGRRCLTSPFATSFTDPSPPTTTSSRAPPSAASRASSESGPPAR